MDIDKSLDILVESLKRYTKDQNMAVLDVISCLRETNRHLQSISGEINKLCVEMVYMNEKE